MHTVEQQAKNANRDLRAHSNSRPTHKIRRHLKMGQFGGGCLLLIIVSKYKKDTTDYLNTITPALINLNEYFSVLCRSVYTVHLHPRTQYNCVHSAIYKAADWFVVHF